MLNKVVAKLARKLNNPNVGEKTRKRVVERVNKASNEKNAPEPGNYPVRGIEGGRVFVDKPIQANLDKSSVVSAVGAVTMKSKPLGVFYL